jgi:hypothetical protein
VHAIATSYVLWLSDPLHLIVSSPVPLQDPNRAGPFYTPPTVKPLHNYDGYCNSYHDAGDVKSPWLISTDKNKPNKNIQNSWVDPAPAELASLT